MALPFFGIGMKTDLTNIVRNSFISAMGNKWTCETERLTFESFRGELSLNFLPFILKEKD